MFFGSKSKLVLAVPRFGLACFAAVACSSNKGSPPPDLDISIVEPSVHPVVKVTMNANDLGGSATNTQETFLNIKTVNATQFGKLFSLAVDGDQYAQPLYVGGLKMIDGKMHNVVFVATEHDSVYAFDADDGNASPLWKVSVGTSIPVPAPWFGAVMSPTSACATNSFNMKESGITGTPVIDPTTQTLYVVALNADEAHSISAPTCVHTNPNDTDDCDTYTCNQPSISYRLHALDLTTGAEKAGSPVTIDGEVDGTVWANASGKIPFDARLSLARPSLLLDYGTLYFATASYADQAEYHGWVFAYDATTLGQKAVFNDSPNGKQGGIWMSGRAMVSDHKGYVYVVTGNGTFDANSNGGDYGDSVLKLDAKTLKVSDWFSPFFSDVEGENFLEDNDTDLGSAGATLIPNTTLLLATGKTGTGYVIDTTQMGHWHAMNDAVAQTARLAWPYDKTSCGPQPGNAWIYGTPAIWQGPDGTHAYVWGSTDYLKDFVLDKNGHFATKGVCFCNSGWIQKDRSKLYTIDAADPGCAVTSSQGPDHFDQNGPGGVVSVSSNAKGVGTGIVWATRPIPAGSLWNSVPGELLAFDATNVSSPIWTSIDNTTRDDLGNWGKFVPPTVANGKVYMATQSNKLVVYGLLPTK